MPLFLDNRWKIVAIDNGSMFLHRDHVIIVGQRNDCPANDSGNH